jgi:phosphohistidine swiveling domain-containing protein
LAQAAVAQPEVAAVLACGGKNLIERVAQASPSFALDVENALEAFGHRGPGECELANSAFADDPDLLLRTVARSMLGKPETETSVSAREISRWARPLARYARRVTGERERNRDRVVRAIWVTRRLVREQGRRLADACLIEGPDDVFYLTALELFAPGSDARSVIARRRDERARLGGIRLPVVFTAPWKPEPTLEQLTCGEELLGVPASPGRARGAVRVVTSETVDQIEPGEVLVSHVTDVGYTPMFGYAAAVVTDIGGLMSHAAVVAREFGVPAVVDTADATTRLADGMTVDVDGSRGTITVIETAQTGEPLS